MDKPWLKAELPVEEREELLLKKMNLNGKNEQPRRFQNQNLRQRSEQRNGDHVPTAKINSLTTPGSRFEVD